MGPIQQNVDLLLEYDVKIVGELKLRVSHCLIANRGATLASIKSLHVHPAAAAQCDRFIREHAKGWTVYQTYDTAGSVKLIKEQGILDGAAIASAEAAKVYGMEVLAEGIEDNPQNYTRFVVVAKNARVHDKCNKASLVYSTKNEPGALYATLRIFAERKINLSKLESRPIPGRPWEYMFYVDIDAHIDSPEVKEALRAIEPYVARLKVLGCYPAA
jgi:prephenate dehydratase